VVNNIPEIKFIVLADSIFISSSCIAPSVMVLQESHVGSFFLVVL
jgi:hypothetical protein